MGDRLGTLGAVGFKFFILQTFSFLFLCPTGVDVINLVKRFIWKGLVRFPDASIFLTLTAKEPKECTSVLSTRSRVVIASSKEA